MARKLLCLNCAKRVKPIRERNGISMFCTGTLKIDRALSDVIVGSGDEEKRYPPPSPCLCDLCGEPIEKGERACCYQYWREGHEFERHGWEHDYLGGELVYEFRDY
jgi:hypothetical protein